MKTIRKKVEFTGSDQSLLAGLLELPEQPPLAFALFAHCFTCGKDIAAASRISRALAAKGIAVLRFDFTGLGGSDGDFSNTNFSSNVQDLVLAAEFLDSEYMAPNLLIGHSLGGTAVLRAAFEVASCEGVVTIGSPADAEHVIKQFSADLDTIEQQGVAEVSLAGRQFTIRKQFLDDARDRSRGDLARLGKPLLVFHSPVDTIVSINQAEKIYQQARHPKSFVSLDKADHLLSDKADAEYVAGTIAAWAARYVSGMDVSQKDGDSRPVVERGRVQISEKNRQFTLNVHSDDHHWLADEPLDVGGANLGPDPYEHLLAALGTCTVMTVRMYAGRKQWPLEDTVIELSHSREHGEDCAHCDDEHSQIDLIKRRITFSGALDDDQKRRLMEIADRCPVHRTLTNKLVIETEAGKQTG